MKFDRCGSALDLSACNNIPLASATLSCWPVCHVQPSTTTRTIDVTTFPLWLLLAVLPVTPPLHQVIRATFPRTIDSRIPGGEGNRSNAERMLFAQPRRNCNR